MPMTNNDREWMYGGAVLIALISSLPLTQDYMSPWVPMPVYLVVLVWLLFFGSILVLPLIYLLEFKAIANSAYFGRVVLILSVVLAGLDAWYFYRSWEYGLKWQGERHTQIVAIENLAGFAILIALATLGAVKKSRPILLTANLFLFGLLAWCAFPYLGETP